MTVVPKILLIAPILVIGFWCETANSSAIADRPSREIVKQADSLYFAGDYAEAAKLYERATVLVPDDAESISRLGISHHLSGNFGPAILYHAKAATFPDLRSSSLYNLACAYAQLDSTELVFAALDSAIHAGFNNGPQFSADPDLASIVGDPRYPAILRRLYGEGYSGKSSSGPTVEQMKGGIHLIVETIEELHPDPYRCYSPEEWDAKVSESLQRIETANEAEYYMIVRELAGMACDVHTSAFPKRGSDLLKYSLPLRFWKFSDGLFIRAASADLSPLVGARVDAIGGVATDTAWNTVMRWMSTENEWMSAYMTQMHLQFPAYLEALGICDSPRQAEFTLTLPNGNLEVVSVDATDSSGYLGSIGTSIGIEAPQGWTQGHESASPLPLWLRNKNDNYWFHYLRDYKTVFMQFNVPRGKRTQSFGSFVDSLVEFVAANDVERLVIDLRHNEGGWAYHAQTLVHGVLRMSTLNSPGRLYVVTSRTTQSAGVTIAAKLDLETYAIIVGEPSGAHPNFFNGPMGNHAPRALPGSNVLFRVSTELEQNSDPLDKRRFIAPDIWAPMSYTDLEDGIDPSLQAALTFPIEKAIGIFQDPGGRDIPLYFHWTRPSQEVATLKNVKSE